MAVRGFKILPKNYLSDWGEFESWAAGAASAPDGWIAASTPNLAREATSVKYGSYSALVSGSTTLGGLYRTILNGADYAGRTFKLGVWAKSASTGPYIELNDGVASKTVHADGTNAFVFLTTPSMKLDYTGTQIRINLFASAAATCYFDGAVLCEGENLFLDLTDRTVISDWQPALSMGQDQYEPSQRQGSLIPDTRLQAKNIRVKGSIVGTDVANTRSNVDDFLKALSGWQTDEKRDLYFYDDRVNEVFLKSYDSSIETGLTMVNYNIQLSCPDSKSRYLGKFRSRAVIAATAQEFSVVYNGSADSFPIFRFIADQAVTIGTCNLENLTTGENFSFTGTMPTNTALEIDADKGTVLNEAVDSIGFFSGDFMRLVRGTNNFRFSGSNCTINIDYFEKYL